MYMRRNTLANKVLLPRLNCHIITQRVEKETTALAGLESRIMEHRIQTIVLLPRLVLRLGEFSLFNDFSSCLCPLNPLMSREA